MAEIIGTDRYEALGMAPPDEETMCDGWCEGTGVVPVFFKPPLTPLRPGELDPGDETDPELLARWHAAEAERPVGAGGGYHIVKCPTCEGTGKKNGA